MDIKNLLNITGDIDFVKAKLTDENYQFAWGDYSVNEIRKAIMTEQPAFLECNGKTMMAVGENVDSIIFSSDNKIYEVKDHELEKSFSGNAVIVQGQKDYEGDLVIFTPERDIWPSEWEEQKERTVRILKKLTIGKDYLPSHPVICTFQKPGNFEIKNVIRAMCKGVEITIYDPSDPVSEFLHELGHIFWDNKLLPEEKQEFIKYQKTFKKGNIPVIYTSQYYHSSGEEIFATIYMYYLKSKIMNPGYLEILKLKESEGYAIFERIIDRLLEESLIKKNWSDNETILRQFIKGKRYRVNGTNRIIKTEVDCPENIYFDRFIDHEVLHKADEREWVKINEGKLSGETIIVNGDMVDVPYMKRIKSRLHLVPKKIINKAGRKQTVWVRPGRVEKKISKSNLVFNILKTIGGSTNKN